MGISAVSSAVAPSIAHATANKLPANPAQEPNKPVAPPAVKSGADSDGDHDSGGGGINVKA